MKDDYKNIKVIGFDADDTLWVNETYFREAEEEFCKLLSKYETPNKIDQELFKKEIENGELGNRKMMNVFSFITKQKIVLCFNSA